MNKIKQFIINSIMKYPTLYLKNDYETSELFVLDHMYFTNGNGFDWNKKGYLQGEEYKNRFKEIPREFFENKVYHLVLSRDFPEYGEKVINLYDVVKDKKEFKELCSKCLVINNDNDDFMFYDIELLNYLNNETKKFNKKFKEIDMRVIHSASPVNFFNDSIITPHICKYSKIYEFLVGKDYSNETIYVHPDNYPYMKKIIEYAIKFYNDVELYKNHYYYKEYKRIQKTEKFDNIRNEQIDILNKIFEKLNNVMSK